MRRCVTCQQTYDDQSLKFCRNDGSPLINDSSAPRFPDSARFPDSSSPDPVEAMTLPYPAGTTGEPTSRSLRDASHSTSQKLRNAGPSIAVMPLTNISANPENEYFCDGMAEELLNALAKVEGLKVAARTSAFSFKGRNATVEEIGRALNVNSVLEGSVRRAGNRLRISVQLLSVAGTANNAAR